MPINNNLRPLWLRAGVMVVASVLSGTMSLHATDRIWDGGAGNGLWTSAANWNPDGAPVAGDQLTIANGNTVNLAGLPSGNLPTGCSVTIDGGSSLTQSSGAARLAGSTVTLGAGGSISGGFWDLNNGTVRFSSGATVTTTDWEHKGTNVFRFELGPSGFPTLTPGRLRAGNGATWANATYQIDVSAYQISNGTRIVLADYASHDAAYSGTFNPAVNIIAGTSGLHGTLGFNTTLSQLVLTIDPAGNDAPTALNQSVSTPVNTAVDFVLSGTDPEGGTLTYAVVTGPGHGTLSGTAPNLTYTPADDFIGLDALTFTVSDGLLLSNAGTVTFAATPQTAAQLWASLDTAIRTDALNTEWQTTWVQGAVTLHQIRFDLGTLTGTQRAASPKIAAYYAYPTGGTNLPGIVGIHGGGQRASDAEARYWAEQGYACISINWGGLPLIDGLANTDWDGLPAGFVRTGVTEAIHREQPEGQIYKDGSTLFADAHPLNISYLLCSYAARRALTFLAAQGNVASGKLGVTGHSMGGQITVLTATDPRVTCVTPSVGGSGYLFRDWWGLPGTARHMNSVHLDWYERTADPLSYWPDITCPTLFLQSSNDFNAPFDLVTKGMAQQSPAVPQRLAVAPHFNHRFDDASYASRVLWQKAHLTGDFDFPQTPVAELDLNQNNGIPLFSVWPDAGTAHNIVSVDIHYGYDRNSLTRFWRDAGAVETSPGLWQARCPVHDTDEPLVAYAIVTYDCGFNLAMPAGYTNPTRHFSVVSEVKTVYPPELANHGVRATETELRKIDDFSRGFHDWFILNPGHPTLFEFWTRKPNDPTWNGASGSRLSLGVTTTEANSLGITLQTVQWNSSAATEYHATVALNSAGVHAVSLQVSDFTNGLNEPLTTWDHVKLLRLSAGRIVDGTMAPWTGAIPVFSNLRWEGGSYPEDFTSAKGTPYLWLYENGLVSDGDYAAADLNDSDSDGGNNWEEYQAGTDPNNPASAFKITSVNRAGNQNTIEWRAVAGKTYSVWFSDDLTESNWILKEAGIPGVEPTTRATVPADGNRGFFRIGVR